LLEWRRLALDVPLILSETLGRAAARILRATRKKLRPIQIWFRDTSSFL